MPHVLIVDDDENTREALTQLVIAEGFTVAGARDVREGTIQLGRQLPDAILSDLRLPDGSGLDLLRGLDPKHGTQMILMTGHASVDSAVDALRLGVADYLVKPVNLQRLRAVLARIPRTVDLRAHIAEVRQTLADEGRFGTMVGRSPAMLKLYDEIARVGPTDATVLVVGESGTGKELVAQTLHRLSTRRDATFIAINCGAISPNLIESEMFGHERGSFTGAERQHKGYFERADGGTLFLDEITEMPLELQVKLLRVLETGMLLRVGTTKETAADVRVIAATNRDPELAVRQGRLREDLYHRLNVFPIDVPPLRMRGDDVTVLAQASLDTLNAERRTSKKFAPELIEALAKHDWPGNVRELKNFVQRAFILADDGLLTAPLVPITTTSTGDRIDAVSIPIGTSLAEADRQLIFATLKRCEGVKKRAAQVLGISSKTLYNRLEEYAAADPSGVGTSDEDDDEDYEERPRALRPVG
jgi:DNA-binding NtrC family response regulator